MDPEKVPSLHLLLRNRYRSLCKRNLNSLSACLQKSASTYAGLEFLLRCRRCHVFPAFVSRSVKFAQLGRTMERLARKLLHKILRVAIRDMRIQSMDLQEEIDSYWRYLERMVTDVFFWNMLVKQKDCYFDAQYLLSSQKLKKKFIRLFAVYPNDSYTDNVSLLFQETEKIRTPEHHPSDTGSANIVQKEIPRLGTAPNGSIWTFLGDSPRCAQSDWIVILKCFRFNAFRIFKCVTQTLLLSLRPHSTQSGTRLT